MEISQYLMHNVSKQKEELFINSIDYKLVDAISGILEVVLQNTIEFNKYSTIDEIHEKMSIDLSTEMIEKICDLFCLNDGILIKFMNRTKIGYKLNGKYYIIS